MFVKNQLSSFYFQLRAMYRINRIPFVYIIRQVTVNYIIKSNKKYY